MHHHLSFSVINSQEHKGVPRNTYRICLWTNSAFALLNCIFTTFSSECLADYLDELLCLTEVISSLICQCLLPLTRFFIFSTLEISVIARGRRNRREESGVIPVQSKTAFNSVRITHLTKAGDAQDRSLFSAKF